MKAQWMYRISAVLLVLFSAGHTLGFSKVDPNWHLETVVNSMQSIQFSAQGSLRTYWDFYVGFGLFVSVLLLFAALVCWQLAILKTETRHALRWLCWSLVACFAGVAFLNWKYFFAVPLVFSVVVLLFLTLGAWLSGRSA